MAFLCVLCVSVVTIIVYLTTETQRAQRKSRKESYLESLVITYKIRSMLEIYFGVITIREDFPHHSNMLITKGTRLSV